MKKIIATISILLCFVGLRSQSTSFSPEFNIDLGITDYGEILNYSQLQGLYTVNLEYKPLSYLGLGGQLSYGGYKMYNYSGGETKLAFKVFEYAAFAKLYLTPLFTRIEDPKFTVYLKGKVGGLNIYPRVDEYERSNNFEYGAYVGFRYAPLKRLAVYAEIGYGKYSFTQFGLTYNLTK